jgi:hypothetical protein
MSDQNYLASLRGGSIIPAGYKKQFLPLDSGARGAKISRVSIVPVTAPAVTYLQAEPVYKRTNATGLFFSFTIQAPVMRIATYTGSDQ